MAKSDEAIWQIVKDGRVSAEVLRRLTDQAKAEEARLREQILMLQGNLQQQQRMRLMIGQLLDQVTAEAVQAVAPVETEQAQEAAPPPPPQEGNPAEAEYLAAIEAARAAGKCDFSEGVHKPICGKKTTKGSQRCKAHQ